MYFYLDSLEVFMNSKNSITINNLFITFVAFSLTFPYHNLVENLSLFNILVIIGLLIYTPLVIIGARKIPISFIIICFFISLNFLVALNKENYDFIKIILWPMLLMSFFIYLFNDKKNIYFFIKCYIYTIAFTCLLSFLQVNNIKIAWDFRYIFGLPLEPVLLNQFSNAEKGVGLAYFSVQFSYQILLALGLLFSFFSKKTTEFKLLFTLLFVGVLSVKSITLFIILVTYILFNFNKIKFFNILIFLIFSFFLSDLIFDRFFNIFQDSGFTSRISLISIAALILNDLPFFGFNPNEVNYLKNYYSINISASSWVSEVSFHNSFLTNLIYFGYLSFLSYFFIWYYSCYKLLKNKYLINKELFINYLILIFSYILMSSFHNAGIQTGDIYGWIIVSIPIVFYKLR